MTGKQSVSSATLTVKAAKRFGRRTMLRNAAAAGAVLAAGPWLTKNAFSSSGELNVFSWSDYMPEAHIKGFTDKTGIKINFTGYGSNEDLLAKIQATKGRGFDLISPTVDRVNQWKPLGVLQPNKLTARVGLKIHEIDSIVGWRGTFANRLDRADPGEEQDAYQTHDIFASWQPQEGILRGFRLDAGIDNMFDRTYTRVYTDAPEPGRDFKIAVGYGLTW